MSLECKDLIKIYSSPIEGINFTALRGVNLTVTRGEFVSIIGPSGVGKTTLLRLISTFDTPSSGEIWFNDQLINKLSRRDLLRYRQNIGFMFQSPRDNLIWGLTALDNVLLPLHYSGNFQLHQRERAFELLNRLGLTGKEERKPAELSGGEQQRVAIAVALANDPKLLLADEPTGELDTETTKEIIEYLREINEVFSLSIIVVTHDKRFSNNTEKTYRMQDGRISTFHVQSKDPSKTSQREEAIIMDSDGNIRLPQEIYAKLTEQEIASVRVIMKDNKIEIIPFKEKKNDIESE